MKNISKYESEVRGYSRSFPKTFVSANGALVRDDEGNQYIDFLAGAGSLNYGHNNPFLKTKLLEYLEKDGLTHGLDLATPAKEEFLEVFQDIILRPRNLEYKIQFTGPTGTNTVEAAIKLAQLYTGRTNVISFTNAYHGHTKGSLRLTANQHYRQGFENELNQNSTFMPFYGYVDGDFDSLSYLDKMLTDKGSGMDLPAAVILETVQGEGGVNVAPIGWLKRLRAITEKHGILLIIDDIQVGCGRTGKFFSFEHAGIKPDLVTLSKSLSGFGLPMSILLINPKVDVWKPGHHTGTFRGNNLAFVTAAQAINRYWGDGSFEKEISVRAKKIWNRLDDLYAEYTDQILDVRGKGMIVGVEFKSAELANKISKNAFKSGLIIESCGAEDNILKFLPPLNIDIEQLNHGLNIFEKSIQEVLKGVKV